MLVAIPRITKTIDAYRAGEVSAKIALIAIGIIVDADRLLSPQIPKDLTDDERQQFDDILIRMVENEHYSYTITTTTNRIKDELPDKKVDILINGVPFD